MHTKIVVYWSLVYENLVIIHSPMLIKTYVTSFFVTHTHTHTQMFKNKFSVYDKS